MRVPRPGSRPTPPRARYVAGTAPSSYPLPDYDRLPRIGMVLGGCMGEYRRLGAHYTCEVRFGAVPRFQLGVKKTTLLPEMKMYVVICVMHTLFPTAAS
eukprot:COSAG01_NODE_1023_length_12063_cov_25.977432_18_plen_99_part_00